jgi:hypothetical protein
LVVIHYYPLNDEMIGTIDRLHWFESKNTPPEAAVDDKKN